MLTDNSNFLFQLKRVGLIWFLFLLHHTADAQKDKDRAVGLGTGLSLEGLMSELISPYKHTGGAATFQMYYQSHTEKTLHDYQLHFVKAKLNSSSRGLSTDDTRGGIQYSYHHIFANAGKFVFYGGGSVNAGGSKRSNGQTAGNNDNGELIALLHPSIRIHYPCSKGFLAAQLWAPIFSFVYQPSYGLAPLETNWVGPSGVSGVGSRISYYHYLSQRWTARFDYQFQHLNVKQHESVEVVLNQWIVSIACRF